MPEHATADVAPYRIRVRGELAEDFIQLGWIDRANMTVDRRSRGVGVTTLEGDFDQAALRGLLSYLWDLNLTVLSVDARDGATELANQPERETRQ